MWFMLAVAVLCFPHGVNGAEENVNGAEFNVLCHMTNMLVAEKLEQAQTADLESAAQSAWTEIDNIFTITSNESYYKEGPLPQTGSPPEEQAAKDKRIQEWQTKRKQMENMNEEGSTTRKKYKRKARAEFAKSTSAKLDKLYNTAVRVNEDLANTKRLITTEETKIKKELREALLGEPRDGRAQKPAADAAAFTTAYATSCTGTSGPGKSLANDLVCVCGTGTGAAASTLQQCTSLTVSSGYTDSHTGGTTNAIKIYNKLAAICQKSAATEEASPENIAASIAAFTALLGRHALGSATKKGAYSFGKGEDNSNQCNGGAASGQSCVNYVAIVEAGSGTPITTAITWLKHLTTARTQLITRRQLLQKNEKEQSRLISLADKMQELYQEALHAERPVTTQTQSKPQPTPDPEKQKACEKHTNKTTCEAQFCEWNGTEETIGKCEATTKEQANTAGPGEQAKEGAAATGCARHGSDKAACENDKTMPPDAAAD
uniref:Variant surface glycoprotein 1125.2541 n=1 Tax=Trypanosoma brucei TaxID=5691 RepID=A0A1J0R888_9TRYP|nr:variant surface glycoprotein 1125.2541 [Trypanosoma brucei]